MSTVTDLAIRLAEALDRVEAEARRGASDDTPATVLRLVERDRALLTLLAGQAARAEQLDLVGDPSRRLLEVLAGFWLREPATPDHAADPIRDELAAVLHAVRCGWNCGGHGLMQETQDRKDARLANAALRFLAETGRLREAP